MNEQEMQFANPDWQPPEQEHPVSPSADTVRVEQEHAWNQTYQQGYQGQQTPLAHYQAPLQHGIMGERRRLWPWLVLTIILICLVPVLLSAMAMVVGKNNALVPKNPAVVGKNHVPHGESHAPNTGHVGSQLVLHSYGYDMTHISTLQIDDPTGSIHVHGGISDTHSQIEALSDNSVPDPLQFEPGNNGLLTIKVNAPTDDNPVLLNIILPQNTALTLSTNDGNIEVDGMNSQINLYTANSITLSNDTISGQSNISSTQGNVRIVNSVLRGKYVVSDDHGSIALQQVNLSGQGQIQAQVGANIMMVGMLDPQGNYAFSSAYGEIDLMLPSNTAMRLHIDPGTGNSSSDFPTQTSNGAVLTVKTQSGNIQVRQGP